MSIASSRATDRDIYTVTRLNREARAVLEGSFAPLWVRGEISNLARPASGHIYFSLKDAYAQVRCAMFRNRNRSLKFELENGLEVVAQGGVSLYEGRGEFQLIIERIEPAGEGALQRAFEQLKQRLHKEGLFDEEHKRPVPLFPRRIGVVTSPTGAAIRDILTVLRRRWPMAGVVVYPVPVQGEGAGARIARMVSDAGARAECDVLIVARGGGSLEDLWAFNDEGLARAIHDCPIPVVSGVGHEIDFTIADFVADQRAATPSAAAELVSPDQARIMHHLETIDQKLVRELRQALQQRLVHLRQLGRRLPDPVRTVQMVAQRLDGLFLRITHTARGALAARHARLLQLAGQVNRHDPGQTLKRHAAQCRYLQDRLRAGILHSLERTGARLRSAAHTLNTVSPLATLERGYAIVSSPAHPVIRDAAALEPGDVITARFARGEARAEVTDIKPEND